MFGTVTGNACIFIDLIGPDNIFENQEREYLRQKIYIYFILGLMQTQLYGLSYCILYMAIPQTIIPNNLV